MGLGDTWGHLGTLGVGLGNQLQGIQPFRLTLGDTWGHLGWVYGTLGDTWHLGTLGVGLGDTWGHLRSLA